MEKARIRIANRRMALHKSKTLEPASMLGPQFKAFVKESMCFMWPMASIAEEIDRELTEVTDAVEEDCFERYVLHFQLLTQQVFLNCVFYSSFLTG